MKEFTVTDLLLFIIMIELFAVIIRLSKIIRMIREAFARMNQLSSCLPFGCLDLNVSS